MRPTGKAPPGNGRLFTGASPASRAFELCVGAAAVWLGSYVSAHTHSGDTHLSAWPIVIATAAAGVAAIAPGGVFAIQVGPKTYRNPADGIVLALLLVLTAPVALPIAFAGTLAYQLVRRYYRHQRLTWQTMAFNQAQYTVCWSMAIIAHARVQAAVSRWPAGLHWPVAAVGALLVYVLLTTWIIAVWNALRRRAAAWDLWVRILREKPSTRWIPLAAGVLVAYVATVRPVAALALLAVGWLGYAWMSRLAIARLRDIASAFGSLVEAAERRAPAYAEHSERVSWWAERIARSVGASEAEAETIGIAAKLHDLGRVAMGLALDAEDAGDEDLAAAVCLHPAVASNALMRCHGLETIARYLRSQAEWYDGSGYPDGLAGDAIPLGSRIIAAADAYDVARSRTGDVGPSGTGEALVHVRRYTGTRLDPSIVVALEELVQADAAAVPGRLRVPGREPAAAIAAPGAPGGMITDDTFPRMADSTRMAWSSQEPGPVNRASPAAPPLHHGGMHAVVEAVDAERRRIGREFHDDVGAALTGLSYVLTTLPQISPDQGAETIALARQTLDGVLSRIRDLSLGLDPAELQDVDLATALAQYTARYAALTGIRISLAHRGLDHRADPVVEVVAYKIVQEALTNSTRHAQTDAVSVRVERQRDLISVVVEDHGAGFDSELVRASARGTGLAGMRERAVSVGGSLTVTSKPGRGTKVEASLPISTGPWRANASH